MNINKNNIIIFGAYGFLGNHLSISLSSKYNVYRQGRGPDSQIRTDLLDYNKILDILKSIKPICVINLIAETNVDLCENNSDLAREINTNGVRNICDTFKGKIVQLSTDYVFDGKDGPYVEEDEVFPPGQPSGAVGARG